MHETQTGAGSVLTTVSNAMVRLHKEQFGRGPTRARSNFAGADVLICVLEDALLPAEVKLVALDEQSRVRDARTAFQAATQDDFVQAIEEIVDRRVHAFASGVDPDRNVVFECFYFEPRESADGDDGRVGD